MRYIDTRNDSVTNSKLGTDVKVGSLAALTTTTKASIQAAVNELVASIAAISSALGSITRGAQKTIQLNGWAWTPVVFSGPDVGAAIYGIDAPVDMSTPGNGGTIKITADSEAEETVTMAASAGVHTGGTGASTDMVGEIDTKFAISADGELAETVTCNWAGCNSGNTIASQIQTVVRALGGVYQYISVVFNVNQYIFTSGSIGNGSAVIISRAADHDCCDELDIGPDNGTSVSGAGDCADITAVTPEEIKDMINASMTNVIASLSDGALMIESKTQGRGSRVLAGDGTLNTLCGIPNAEVGFGAQSMGEATDWADDDYSVHLTLKGIAAAGQGLSWDVPTVSGFNISCETTSKTDYVCVLVVE